MDVEHRRVVERDADGAQLRGQRRWRSGRASASSPLRPSVAIGGHSVNGAFSRATRPPSWSTLTHSGSSAASAARSCDSSATCSGASMLRAKRITPPSSNSRASDRISAGIVVPGQAADQQLPDVASRRQRHDDMIPMSTYNSRRAHRRLPRRPASTSPAAPSTSGRSISSTPARRRSTRRSACGRVPRIETRARRAHRHPAPKTPACTVEADDWPELRDRRELRAAVAAGPLLRGARHHADDASRVARRRRHRRLVGAERRRLRARWPTGTARTTSRKRCCRSR